MFDWIYLIWYNKNMKRKLKDAINCMKSEIVSILKDNVISIYIYGSCVLNDFKLGWSDIDLLVLTKNNFDNETANKLLTLRQDLLKKNPQNKFFRSFEGAILPLICFLNQTESNVVYWGTKGEKLKTTYKLDSFSIKELIENGLLIYGDDVAKNFNQPTFNELKQDIIYHYQTIREHAQTTGRNLYSFGWFLDISRCIYTLKTGNIISKTQAGVWALKNNLCPDRRALKISLKVRKNPQKHKNNPKIMDYAEILGDSVQKYADVLEKYL